MAVKHNQPITEAIAKIEQCLTEVTDWYGMNQLKLNIEKSEAVIFLTSKQRNDLPFDISVTIGGHRVVPKPSVRNLGVILDSGLTMQAQVAQITKSCYHQIRNIGQIRSSITDDACKTLVHAFVTARLDYANALPYRLPQTTLQRLQRVQNCAARLVSRTRKYDRIMPVLQHLHWLPIGVHLFKAPETGNTVDSGAIQIYCIIVLLLCMRACAFMSFMLILCCTRSYNLCNM